MMIIGLFLSFCVGIGVSSVLSQFIKTEFENINPTIPSDQHPYSIPFVESIVDARFKLLAADFQDRLNDVKGQVATLNSVVMSPQHPHEIQKRQTNTSTPKQPIFENSNSFCTFFHPDHPDAGRKKFNHSANLCEEIVSDPTKVKEKLQNNTSKPKRPICENSSSLCTFFHPDHPDADRKRFNHSATIPDEVVLDPTKVKGIPSNCSDLRLLGHKLNGLYLVKSSQPNQTTKIETVFCNFQSEVSQEMVGKLDIKTKIVHFYVQRNTTFATIGVIPFQLDRLNEGGAMNLNTGIFTVPVPGIYHFEFCGLKHRSDYLAAIKLQINGEVVAIAKANSQRTDTEDSLSLTASFRLRKGDNVNLFNVEGVLSDDESHYTQFAGWLVEEDLI